MISMALSKPYIIDEVSKMDEHAELINGELVIRDSTSIEHNRITVKMARIIGNYIDSKNGNCEVFQENAALFCNELNSEFDNDFYLPDIMVVCEPEGKIQSNGVHAVPDFVAEVTSPSTRGTDYADKLYVYSKIGVHEYWIVDLQNKSVVKYICENHYIPEYHLHPQKIPMSIYNGELEIDFNGLL